ncbi:hypothetical protein EYF80_014689 [Liparis tanakae]|uniref:Uncharacterized protein n=1 Tax=Liparis tanakae TaxID=230148 RepID=A0A4Z2IAQ7_9TELE|nr:hypothetical protein EYF80_014689 [Liparis tanakae]
MDLSDISRATLTLEHYSYEEQNFDNGEKDLTDVAQQSRTTSVNTGRSLPSHPPCWLQPIACIGSLRTEEKHELYTQGVHHRRVTKKLENCRTH